MRRSAFVRIAAGLLLGPGVAAASEVVLSTSAVPFEAGVLVHDEKQGRVYFWDGFNLSRGSQSVSGQSLVYDANSGVAVATGSVVFDDPNIVLRGEYLEAYISSETAHWPSGVRGVFKQSPWRFQAKDLRGTTEKYYVRRVRFTSCDKLDPDYHIWAWKGTIRPGRKAAFQHAVFHIGPVPFWYWPYYTKSLTQKARPTLYLNPGQNGRDGQFLRSVIAFPLAGDKLYLRTHVDYFGKLGIGGGPEFLFRESESRKGSLYLYTIREPSGLRQWDARGDGYYEIVPGLSTQGTFRYQRDPAFNNLYNKDNPERVMPALNSSMAVSWSRRNFQIRSFYSDIWGFDQKEGRFRSTTQTLPGLEGVLHPQPLAGGLLFIQGNTTLARMRSRSSFEELPFDRWQDTGSASVFRPWGMPFVSFINGTIGAFFDHSYQSALSLTDLRSTKQSGYGGNASLRMAPHDILDLSFTYTHRLRSEKDSLRQDTQAADRGVAQKKLDAQQMSRLPFWNANIYARTGYNFPTIPGTKLIHWTQNLDPVWGTLSLSPLIGSSWNLGTTYEVFNRKYTHTVTLTQAAGRQMVTGNFQWANSDPRIVMPAVTANLSLPLFHIFKVTWRGIYVSKIVSGLSARRETLKTFEKEFVIVPGFHDFFLTLVFRHRKDVREFFFTIRLRLAQQTEQKLLKQLNEQEFFPWRPPTE
ncbi:MAG: LPS-assembly protein LptD [Elusimicrobia bacterium]|nr:LPS-assembly protein LptD [Elusimicrobiota bacterium]